MLSQLILFDSVKHLVRRLLLSLAGLRLRLHTALVAADYLDGVIGGYLSLSLSLFFNLSLLFKFLEGDFYPSELLFLGFWQYHV